MKRELFRNTMSFGVGLMISQIIGFISLPMILRQLSITDYGTYGLITSSIGLISMFSTLSLGNALFKFGSKEDIQDKVKKKYINTMLVIVVSSAFLVSFVLFVSGIVYKSEIMILITFFSFIKTNDIAINYILRATNNVNKYIIKSIMYSLLYFFGIFILSTTMNLTLNNLVLVVIFSETITVIYGYIVNSDIISVNNFSKVIAKRMLLFSIPLLGASLIEYLLQYLDIWMIAWQSDISQAGFFNFAKKFNLVILMFKSAFFLAWPAIGYRIIDQKKHQSIFDILTFSMFLVMALIISFSDFLIIILGGENYLIVNTFLSVSVLGAVLGSIGMFIDTSAGVSGSTKLVSFVSSIGLVVDLLGNYYLIPILGAKGAALSTALAYLIMFSTRIYLYEKMLDFKVWTNKGLALTFSVTLIVISFSFFNDFNVSILGIIIILQLLFVYRSNLMKLFDKILFKMKNEFGVK